MPEQPDKELATTTSYHGYTFPTTTTTTAAELFILIASD